MSWSAARLATSCWTALRTVQGLSTRAFCRWTAVYFDVDAMSSTAGCCTNSSFAVSTSSSSSPPPRPAAETTAACRRHFTAAQQFYAPVIWILGRQWRWVDVGDGLRIRKSPTKAVLRRAGPRPAGGASAQQRWLGQTGKTETTSDTLHTRSAQRAWTLIWQDSLSGYLHARGTCAAHRSHWITCSGRLLAFMMALNFRREIVLGALSLNARDMNVQKVDLGVSKLRSYFRPL